LGLIRVLNYVADTGSLDTCRTEQTEDACFVELQMAVGRKKLNGCHSQRNTQSRDGAAVQENTLFPFHPSP
jgi:hypothetical protein